MTEDVLICEACGDEYEAALGCQHEGHQRCPADLYSCKECRDAINDYVRD